jgi:carbon storage regulator
MRKEPELMLVLSRLRDETIMIGEDVEITVVDIRGDKVRLGINAPTSIAVHRKEVYEAIRQENQRAASLADDDLDRLGENLNRSRIEGRSGAAMRLRSAASGVGKSTTTSEPPKTSAARPTTVRAAR